ncbi:MAG: DUF1559 domain-containing protein [Thermoguttaceae bacterium]|jgi:prepilin-type N-terminal cleavage/methylation domain-containing protein
MNQSRRHKVGFTLVELLVVISIIGILVALIVPAVSSIRESARRATCKNNLKQMGIAATAHVEKYGTFPSGGWGMNWTGDPDRGSGARQPGGWIYQLLPYMGYDFVHDFGKGLGQATSGSAKYIALAQPRGIPLPTFICPTRRKAIAYPDGSAADQQHVNADKASAIAHNDYAANAGTTNIIQEGGPDTSCYQTFPSCSGWTVNQSTADGVVYEISEVKPAHITDGLSNTFFAGEKYLNTNNYYNSQDEGDDNSLLHGHDHDTLRWCTTGILPLQDTPGSNGSGSDNFGSAHSSGVHFVFCNGSVQMINYSIDPTVYQNLGCRCDGNVSENY